MHAIPRGSMVQGLPVGVGEEMGGEYPWKWGDEGTERMGY